MKGRAGRALRTALWAAVLGAALVVVLPGLDALGGVLVLPASYHTGLRILFGGLWVVGVVAIYKHADDGEPPGG